jgi:hypothetical protein
MVFGSVGCGDCDRHGSGPLQVGFDSRRDPRAVCFVDGASEAWGQGQARQALRFGHGLRVGLLPRLESGLGCENWGELELEISRAGL